MRVLVFGGSGRIGAAVAWDLVRRDDVEAVGLVGRRRDALSRVAARLGSPKLGIHEIDISDRRRTMAVMEGHDVGVSTLPDRRTSYRLVDAAIEAGLHVVDVLEEYHRRPDPHEPEGLERPDAMSLDEYGDYLHQRALERGVTILDGFGFAPGLSNIMAGEAIRKLDAVESVIVRVGGIPSKDSAGRHPLRYMITWAFRHVLREYVVKPRALKGGREVEVDALTDREHFRFDRLGIDEELECAVTSGMPSFVATRPHLREFAAKTIRWPGHYSAVDTLKECGLLELAPVVHDGRAVVPREFLITLIEPRLRQRAGDSDVCVMYNTVIGARDGVRKKIEHFMWAVADPKLDLSAMARVTGFSAAIGAWMIGKGLISRRGIVAPEDCVAGDAYRIFMDEMKSRQLTILEEVTDD